MEEIYTTGRWKANAGKEDAFVDAWGRFAAWASGMPGAGDLRLTRDEREREVFVSFAAWESIDERSGVPRAFGSRAPARGRVRAE
jgi:heme-degrading monooxygenase HmoA